MDAEANTLPEDSLTHSFLYLVAAGLKHPVNAVTGIHKTLKKGGIAILADTNKMAHDGALIAAHNAVRGPDSQLMIPLHSASPDHKAILISGGFAAEDVKVYDTIVFHVVKDLERWVGLLWSYLGMRAGAEMWTKEDEEKWDQAVKAGMKVVEASDLTEITEEAGKKIWKLKFTAKIAVATKN